MKRVLLCAIFCFSLLAAQENEFEKLLNRYANHHELYLSTKKENAGHVIIFSRRDIDRMQAYILDDLLKTVRFFNIKVDSRGFAVPVLAGASNSYNQPIRIYIDNYQIESNTFGSPLDKIGKINLYFIDHVEIYLLGSSTQFGGDPGSIVIKLYTKKPERENGTFLQLLAGSDHSNSEEILFAGELNKDYSLLFNATRLEDRYDTIHSKIGPLDRDGKRYDFYAKLNHRDDFEIDMEYIHHRYDILKSALKKDIRLNEGKLENLYIHLNKRLPWQMMIDVSFTNEENGFEFLTGTPQILSNNKKVSSLEQTLVTEIGYGALTKTFEWNKAQLLLRAEHKSSHLRLKRYNGDGNAMKHISGNRNTIRRTAISAHFRYDIDDSNRLVVGLERAFVDLDRSSDKTLDYARAGYITNIYKRFDVKVFATHKEIMPTSKELYYSTVIKSNPNLKPYTFDTYSTEIIYNADRYTLEFGGGKNFVEDIVTTPQNPKSKPPTFINSGRKTSSYKSYLRLDYFLDTDNKWTAEIFKTWIDDPASPTAGAYLALFNSFGRFECYNGLVYREEYTDRNDKEFDASFDWTAAITWHKSKHLLFKLKGENLLDRALESYIADDAIATPRERRLLIGMEYTF